MTLDLVPFGFTPTESRAYAALLSRGPTSAYELSKQLGVARANTYQALNGLVTKNAAKMVSREPQVFKPIAPAALVASVATQQAAKLDALHEQLRGLDAAGHPSTVEFSGHRAFGELVLRTTVRAERVSCVAPAGSLNSLTPVWRKRAADGAETDLWVVQSDDSAEPDRSLRIAGRVEAESMIGLFGAIAALVWTPDAAIVGKYEPDQRLNGYWSGHPLWIGCAWGCIKSLTA